MLLSNLNLLATAPDGVAKLRELILTLAVQGKLVPQDPSDEPASELLKKIRAEKDRLIAEGKIKRDKPLAEIAEEEKPFELPNGWEWVRATEICTLITDGDHLPPPKADSGIPFLVIGDVRDGYVDLQRVSRCVPTDYFDKLDWGKKPLVGDILYTTVGSFGIPVPIAMQQDFCFQRHIALFRPAMLDLQGCMALIFRSSLIYQQAEAGATGIAQKTVPLSALRNLYIPLPPLAEQSRIVTRVEELMRLCDALEAKARLEATQHEQLVRTLLSTLTTSTTPDELTNNWHRVATHFDLLLDRPEAVDALEQTILQLAVRGLLVPQDPQDEPASELLKKIRTEKDRLIAEGKIKRDKPLPPIAEDERPFELPDGWEWARMGEIGLTNIGLTYTPNNVAETGTPVLRSNNVQAGKLDLTDLKRVNVKVKESVLVAEGDLLICARNGSKALVGKTAQITGLTEPMAFGAFMAIFRSEVNGYVLHFINSPQFRRMISEVNTTTINQITQENLRSTVLPLPPLAEQSRIVARVTSLRALCADLRQRLTTARTQQALLAQALVGEVA